MTTIERKRVRAVESCEITREKRARLERSTRHIVLASLRAGMSVEEVADHTGLTPEEVEKHRDRGV
ncbi:hypothetical protein Leucomu_05845 [Leucobacter muris]|uniref:Helix-turn-helix domain-containing protein n=1 Tax=Leucobacter muris TaxID=1935379 RepID=A0ABX5QER9_9MICO|nr:hypothetical protein [Leucobacter muris]QAB17508.1 hypothetical protein Leucomu_05845 [Leucobacter muris]